MGTSTSYGGPKGKNPLIPSGLEDNQSGDSQLNENGEDLNQNDNTEEVNQEDNNQIDKDEILDWKFPKGSFTRFANSSGNSSKHLQKISSQFVKAHGGFKNAAKSAVAGKQTIQRLGGVLSSIATDGLEETIKRFKISGFIGKDYNLFFNAIVNFISPDGANLEESIARTAAIDTMVELFEKFEIEEKGIDELNNLDLDNIQTILKNYLHNYIYARLLQTLIKSAELKLEASTLKDKESEVKDYLSAALNLDFKNKNMTSMDWEGQEGVAYVEQLFEESYRILV